MWDRSPPAVETCVRRSSAPGAGCRNGSTGTAIPHTVTVVPPRSNSKGSEHHDDGSSGRRRGFRRQSPPVQGLWCPSPANEHKLYAYRSAARVAPCIAAGGGRPPRRILALSEVLGPASRGDATVGRNDLGEETIPRRERRCSPRWRLLCGWATCIDTTSNGANCGSCGLACTAGQICTNSECGEDGAQLRDERARAHGLVPVRWHSLATGRILPGCPLASLLAPLALATFA